VRNVRHKRDELRRAAAEDFATLFGRHGLSMTFGRIFGLLITSEESMGLDDIGRELGLSKSAVSRTVRDLEAVGVVRRRTTPGSRRIVFNTVEEPPDGIIVAAVARLRDLRDLFASTSRAFGETPAGRRLAGMAELYGLVCEENERVLERWREKHR
jgi:DNA-binding MarR family transcriptional regulator